MLSSELTTKLGVFELARVVHCPLRFGLHRGYFVVQVKDFALVELQAFDDVLEGVRVYGFLEGLAQEILAALGVGEVSIDREQDVIGDQRFAGGEEAEAALDHAALVVAEGVGAVPGGDVRLQRRFRGHPGVVKTGKVSIPSEIVADGHELVDVGFAHDHALVFGFHPIVEFGSGLLQAFIIGKG